VGDHEHAASSSRDDGGGDDGLAGAGRRDKQDLERSPRSTYRSNSVVMSVW